jgi:hypothetical protein
LDESTQNFDLAQGKYLSENYLQQIVDNTKLKYGLIKVRGHYPINPALIQEASRPSIISQHIEYAKKKEIKKLALLSANL